jgi:hypothetical protein
MDELETPTKIDLQYTEFRVIFSICDCSLDKEYSFWRLDREQATRFLKRLQYIEKLTWGQFASLPQKNGITIEKILRKNAEGAYVATKKGEGLKIVERAMRRYGEEYL